MKNFLVDTNVIIRFIIGDQKEHHRQTIEWFAQAQRGEIKLIIPSLVIAESVFVLASFYKKSNLWIGRILRVLLSQQWLSVEDRQIFLNALSRYMKGLQFVDCYLWSKSSEQGTEILSFDQKLKKKMQR